MVKLEINGYVQLDTFVAVKLNKISVSVEEVVVGECEHKLLVPQRREI